ncbi:MAG: hypothetical protein RLY31_1086 [Bacteroidota bacterium]|jgi:sodium-dependent dicarboxylate transporter 2/3/5
MTGFKQAGFILSPLLAVGVLCLPVSDGLSGEAIRVLAIATLMIGWWVSEAVPIPVTALLPMLLLPFLGVTEMKAAAAPYAHPIVYLFFGGFMLALALEKWNLHRRIALNIVRMTGTHADGIILGFMLSSAFLSMWISNTATTLMMLPIALSVVALLVGGQQQALTAGQRGNFSLSLMLGIAYASSIGGLSTLIGTPPNVIFKGLLKQNFGTEVSFMDWMLLALPFSVLMLAATYLVLVRWLFPNRLGEIAGASDIILSEVRGLGRMETGERRTMIVFLLTAGLWVFGGVLNQLNPYFKLSDEMVAILAVLLLFTVPVDFRSGIFILEWKDTERLPWGILLLFGGGLSLAEALAKTGVIQLVGDFFTDTSGSFWTIVGLAMVSILLTEIMSNLALVAIFVPVVGGIGISLGIPVVHLTIPVTMAASCAFMLPMSTPPNAIVFASGHVSIRQMVRAGIVLNLVAVLLVGLLSRTLLVWLF